MRKRPQKIEVSSFTTIPQYLNIGIGGEAGVGKTSLLATAGEDAKVLVFDTEGGTITYNNPTFQELDHVTDNIDVVTFDDVDDPSELIHRIESGFDYLIQTKNKEEYDVVAIDSLTELQGIFLELHVAKDPRKSYGAWLDGLRPLIRKARQVPAHVFHTARLRVSENEVTGIDEVRFAVAPSAWRATAGLLHAVGFLEIDSKGTGKHRRTFRKVSFTPTPRRSGAKDRIGFGGELINPTAKDLIDKATEAREQSEEDSKTRTRKRKERA